MYNTTNIYGTVKYIFIFSKSPITSPNNENNNNNNRELSMNYRRVNSSMDNFSELARIHRTSLLHMYICSTRRVKMHPTNRRNNYPLIFIFFIHGVNYSFVMLPNDFFSQKKKKIQDNFFMAHLDSSIITIIVTVFN